MLALKYRPETLDEVVGQKPVTAMLKAMIAKNMVPSAILFAGPRGTGKTSTARILAKTILQSQGAEYSDVIEIDAASHGGVEDIRSLRESTMFSGSRIIILDEAHSMSREAFNALLKLMEEPPEHVTFILVTTEPTKIPETIRSRCIEFTFKRLAVTEIYERLVHVVDAEDRPDVEPELLEFIAFKADGGMRDAIMLLDQALRAEICYVSQYEELLGQLDAGPQVLFACMESHSEAISALREALKYLPPENVADSMVETLADVTLLREGVSIQRAGRALEARSKLAREIGLSQILRIMKILWSLNAKSRNNPAKTLEMAIMLVSEVFNDTSNLAAAKSGPIQTSQVHINPPKATISDIKNL